MRCSSGVPAETFEKLRKLLESIRPRPWTETRRWTVFWTALKNAPEIAHFTVDPAMGRP